MGGGISQGCVIRLCHCSQVLDSVVWEQVSAVPGWGAGSIPGRAALWWAGGLP